MPFHLLSFPHKLRTDDMENSNNQSLMFMLSPPLGSDGVAQYINLVSNALSCRSDADLARLMEVPPSAPANWKRRGSVSNAGAEWFRKNLITKLATKPPISLSLNDTFANASLINLLVETQGTPVVAAADRAFMNAVALPSLAALAKLIAGLVTLHGGDYGNVDLATSLMVEALPLFRAAPHFGPISVDKPVY